MFNSFPHKSGFFYRQSEDRWPQSYYLTILLLIAYLFSGCAPSSSTQLYENPEVGIRLKKPNHWDLTFSERNIRIILETKPGGSQNASARIEIVGSACNLDFRSFDNLEKEMKVEIDQIRELYGLDSVTVVQGLSITENGVYKIAQAEIEIPTMAMGDDPKRNEVGVTSPGVSQTMVIFIITRDQYRYATTAFLYKGGDETINTQAQEIIDSIQITCRATPQLYTNPKIDISLEKPDNWNLEYTERNGMLVLKAKNEIGEKRSARVEISGSACAFRGFSNQQEEVEADIDRLRGLYHLSSVTFIQNLSEARIGDYLVTKAVIGIPVNDWNGKGSGTSASDELQPIAVFAITRTRDTVMAYIYPGQDERLNAQAQEIVDSIRITCAAN